MDETHIVHTAKGNAPKWIRDHADYQSDECLPWPFAIDANVGRGRISFHVDGELLGCWAHRVMCEYVKGPAPADKPQTAHSCGNGHLASGQGR